ncbi:centrosomal protein of 76 kDa-like isoform X2 [Corticium candelabrum]|uniref:centrosomal protein of 76 kDa-like isoform X2 n=1 Tax=Corticium candelabrum TaxID=121492 RepID=UPI002E253022|nr:centrosomal protein of 76 kDa-like isoform X2 [Corticium candelabrum]
MAASLPDEKVTELRQVIHDRLSQDDMQRRIRELVSETLYNQAGKTTDDLDQQRLIGSLHSRGIIDELMTSMGLTNKQKHRPTESGEKPLHVDSSKRYLYLQVLGGKAFLEHLMDTNSSSTFTLYVHFRRQRFVSRSVVSCCEPDLREGFLLELRKDTGSNRMISAGDTLALADPIHLVLIKTDCSGESSLIGSHYMEWRRVLLSSRSRLCVAVEINGVGGEAKVPAGILELRLELMPRLEKVLSDDVVTAQIGLEHGRVAERERLFLVYAKQWWKEYLQVRPSHAHRLVKIFAQDENGINRPVCSYLSPLLAGRLLDNARQAARFVSLFGYERAPTVGGGAKTEQWCSMHAYLSKGKGDCENHAILLCCLLLGFSLDAYVCIGTKAKGMAHAWVMTIDTTGLVTFWESLTGHRYVHCPIDPDEPPAVPQPLPKYPYRTPSDSLDCCQFALLDETLWKCMSSDAIRSVCDVHLQPYWPVHPPLRGNTIDAGLSSHELELELRSLTTEHRQDLGLSTVWDNHLAYLLTPALAAYELERCTGLTAGNSEFQQSIRRSIADGHTFKGFPIQFIHSNARRIFASCLKSPVCTEIVTCRGDQVRLAIRVRIYPYPESTNAVWIMFACKYKSVL